MKKTYVVLDDGETFSLLDGCFLVTIDEDRLSPEESSALDDGEIRQLLSGDIDTEVVNKQDLKELLNK